MIEQREKNDAQRNGERSLRKKKIITKLIILVNSSNGRARVFATRIALCLTGQCYCFGSGVAWQYHVDSSQYLFGPTCPTDESERTLAQCSQRTHLHWYGRGKGKATEYHVVVVVVSWLGRRKEYYFPSTVKFVLKFVGF